MTTNTVRAWFRSRATLWVWLALILGSWTMFGALVWAATKLVCVLAPGLHSAPAALIGVAAIIGASVLAVLVATFARDPARLGSQTSPRETRVAH
jgi:hypothetical protein